MSSFYLLLALLTVFSIIESANIQAQSFLDYYDYGDGGEVADSLNGDSEYYDDFKMPEAGQIQCYWTALKPMKMKMSHRKNIPLKNFQNRNIDEIISIVVDQIKKILKTFLSSLVSNI